MSGPERARVLGGMRVRVGDVRRVKGIGYVALSEVGKGKGEDDGRLRRGRVYA